MFRFALYLQGMADGLGCVLYGLVQDWIGLADTARFAMALSVEFAQVMYRYGRRGTSWLFPFRSVSDMARQTGRGS
jgi:hypothetical protein